MTGKELVGRLEAEGFDLFTGVPCSLLEGVLAALERHPRLPYIPAVREDAALGLAAGAWLGGGRPVVLMQNSGLGTALNALVSLSLLYRLPCLLLVSWRGYQGRDAPEHLVMGEVSPRLLETVGIAHRTLDASSIDAVLAWAVDLLDTRQEPVALLVPPRVLEAEEEAPGPGRPEPGPGRAAEAAPEPGGPSREAPTLSRAEAIRVVVELLGDEPVLHANGMICRESFAVQDRPRNFYMIGSMGLASSMALGLALVRPDLRPVVFDGDGNLLMNLGTLAMVGALRPPNLLHLVFDNEVYGSTGNQPSLSRAVRLDRLAAAAGYRTAARVAGPEALRARVRENLVEPGPHFVLVKVTAAELAVPRIPYPPEAIRDRFRAALARA